MNIPIEQVHEVVKSVQEEVRNSAIPIEDIDMVSATIAMMRLSEKAGNMNGNAPVINDDFGLPLTFVEWTDGYEISSHAHQFLAVAVYLYEEEKTTAFDHNIVMEFYDKARWKKPKNPADVIGKAANKGYFTETENDNDDGKKIWRITRTGYNTFQELKKGHNNE